MAGRNRKEQGSAAAGLGGGEACWGPAGGLLELGSAPPVASGTRWRIAPLTQTHGLAAGGIHPASWLGPNRTCLKQGPRPAPPLLLTLGWGGLLVRR